MIKLVFFISFVVSLSLLSCSSAKNSPPKALEDELTTQQLDFCKVAFRYKQTLILWKIEDIKEKFLSITTTKNGKEYLGDIYTIANNQSLLLDTLTHLAGGEGLIEHFRVQNGDLDFIALREMVLSFKWQDITEILRDFSTNLEAGFKDLKNSDIFLEYAALPKTKDINLQEALQPFLAYKEQLENFSTTCPPHTQKNFDTKEMDFLKDTYKQRTQMLKESKNKKDLNAWEWELKDFLNAPQYLF